MLKRIRGFSRPQTQHSPIHLEDDVFFHPLGRKQPLKPFWGPGKLVCPDKCSGEYAPHCTLLKTVTALISHYTYSFLGRVYLPEDLRQIRSNLPEDLRQIRSYLPEVFLQIRTYLPEPFLSCAVLNGHVQPSFRPGNMLMQYLLGGPL